MAAMDESAAGAGLAWPAPRIPTAVLQAESSAAREPRGPVAEPVRVHAVCTGNVCRSPYTALRLGRELERVAPGRFDISSSGTGALVGQPVDHHTREVLEEHRTTAGGFVARQTTMPMIEQADLILGATRQHVAWVVEEHPRAARKSFTLKAFARIIGTLDELEPWRHRLADVPHNDLLMWRSVISKAAAERQALRLRRPEADDLTDPYRRGREAFTRMSEEAEVAIGTIVGLAEQLHRRVEVAW